jgi:hypothetical protein
MREVRLRASCMNEEAVTAVRHWLAEPVREGMRVLVIGGPPAAAKRQHMLAGICGDGARPVVRPATAIVADGSGNYDFMIRRGVAEIDLGQYAGSHRKSATTTVTGAVQALRHQSTMGEVGHPPVLVFRNHQGARTDCMQAALNSAAGSIAHVIVLTEHPSAACAIASVWDVSLLMLPMLSGMAKVKAEECGYTLQTSHDRKAEVLSNAAVAAITTAGVRSVPALRKLATELLRDQHDGGLLAMLIAERLEAKGCVPVGDIPYAIRKLMVGLEEGYRLHLHWEMFLVLLASHSA